MDVEIVPGPDVVPTKYWHRLDDGRVQCDLCPRFCKLREGQRGLCFVRGRPDDADRADHLRALERLLRRPDREEAAQPLPSRHAGAVLRHRRLQPGLQVLPELGHLASRARSTPWPTRPRPERSPARPRAARLPQRRLHLQRPGDLPRVRRSTWRAACRERGHPDRGGDRRRDLRRAAARVLRATWTPPTSTSRRSPSDFYRKVCGGAARSRCSTRCVYLQARDRRLVRDHDPADPGRERLRRGARRDDPLGRRASSAPTCRCTSPPSIPTAR